MTAITLDGLDFDAADFASAANPLGHREVLAATTSLYGYVYPQEARFPNRIFRAMLNEIDRLQALWEAAVTDAEAAAATALAVASNAPSTTSATSQTIVGSGSVTFSIDDELSAAPLQVGMYAAIISNASAANRMWGLVSAVQANTAPVKDTATIDILVGTGSGTFADWTIIGNTGERGENGTGTPAIVAGDSLKLLHINVAESAYQKSTVAAFLTAAMPSLLAAQIGAVFDGGGGLPEAGKVIYQRIGFDMTLEGWDVLADDYCTCEFDVWVDSYTNFPPTLTDSIVTPGSPSGTPPGIAAQSPSVKKAQSVNLNHWATALSEGDVIAIKLVSISGDATSVSLSLYGVRA